MNNVLLQFHFGFFAGYAGGNQVWREKEPINAHSHLLVSLLGASVTVPVHLGKLALGEWQSIIMVNIFHSFMCNKIRFDIYYIFLFVETHEFF